MYQSVAVGIEMGEATRSAVPTAIGSLSVAAIVK